MGMRQRKCVQEDKSKSGPLIVLDECHKAKVGFFFSKLLLYNLRCLLLLCCSCRGSACILRCARERTVFDGDMRHSCSNSIYIHSAAVSLVDRTIQNFWV